MRRDTSMMPIATCAVLCSCAFADVQLHLDETGHATQVSLDGKPVAGAIDLRIPKPDWAGMHATLEDARGISRQADGSRETIESMAPADGAPTASFRVSVEREEEEARLRYSITPTRDLDTAATIIRIELPLREFAGRKWMLSRESELRSGAFPQELPEDYAFLSERDFAWFGWQIEGDRYLVVAPDWSGFSHMQVQDNRKFEQDHFEVQLYGKTPKVLKKDETYSLAFALRMVDAAELEAAKQRQAQRERELANSMTGSGPAKIIVVQPNAEEVPSFGKFELSIELDAEFTNPFDPEDVSLEGHFVRPDGKEHVVPGFPYWGYERQNADGTEKLTATGERDWRVRYCPTTEGEYRYWLTLNDGASEARSKEATFRATKSGHPGLVRVAKANPLYWEFDNGAPYFAIGENVCWPGAGATYDYDNYWKKLADHGANYARLWVGPFDCFTLERIPRDESDPFCLGKYDLANSWRLDYVIDEAEKRGLKIMFCIDSFNSLRIRPSYPRWNECPYNAALGGPCEKPEEFFTNAEALKLFRRRLRYLIARWSYSPAILSWEFWNEVNIIEKYVSEDVVSWHRDMARYLRNLDPYDHMITTSWAGEVGDPKVDELPELDYIQSHQYGARDAAERMARICYEKAERFGKPHYYGEFGTDWQAKSTRSDDTGIHLHNGLWSAVVSQACGTGMLWWWDNYVEPNNLYHHFRPVAEFVKGIPFNKTEFRKAEISDVRYADPNQPARLETLYLETDRASWEKTPFNQPTTFTVHPDGRVEPEPRLTRLLHGTRNHPDKHNPATFEVDYPEDGQFIVVVTGVSGYGGAKLKVYLDGELKIDKDLRDADDQETTDTLNNYNGDYPLDVPKGKHTIRVVNDGNDWVFVQYRLPKYRRRTDPSVHLYALQCDPAEADGLAAIAWMKNERYNWFNYVQGEELKQVAPWRFTLSGVPDGEYVCEWWDTSSGEVTNQLMATAANGRLIVDAPELLTDLACKVRRIKRGA